MLRVQSTIHMVETISEKSEIATGESTAARRPNRVACSLRFKYYIHDGIDTCRFQLIGELTDLGVAELSGCWRTAKTTVGKRKLILDLRGLKALDEAGTKWVTSMAAEGFEYLPREVFHKGVFTPAVSNGASAGNTRKPSRFRLLAAMFRCVRASSAESSTQAQ